MPGVYNPIGGAPRDEKGLVKHPTKIDWYLVRTSDKNAKSCSVSSFDEFLQAFPGATDEAKREIRQAFARFPNLVVQCYAAPTR
jgi:hypothetical protein